MKSRKEIKAKIKSISKNRKNMLIDIYDMEIVDDDGGLEYTLDVMDEQIEMLEWVLDK